MKNIIAAVIVMFSGFANAIVEEGSGGGGGVNLVSSSTGEGHTLEMMPISSKGEDSSGRISANGSGGGLIPMEGENSVGTMMDIFVGRITLRRLKARASVSGSVKYQGLSFELLQRRLIDVDGQYELLTQ